jgi:hypothetical protein
MMCMPLAQPLFMASGHNLHEAMRKSTAGLGVSVGVEVGGMGTGVGVFAGVGVGVTVGI